MEKLKKWTTDEILFLKENYPTKGLKFCSEKLERTTSAVLTKTFDLKIKRIFWSENEINFLIENYPFKGLKFCSNYLNKTESSVKEIVKKINLKSVSQKKWTENDKNFLIENYPKFGSKFCVENLNRSWSSIIGMATKLNLKSKKPSSYTKEEILFLKENYSTHGVNFCEKKINRTKESIRGKVNSLKLKIDNDVKYNLIKETKKSKNFNKFNIKNIVNVSNKEVAYFLGYFWADGYVRKENGYTSSINLIEEDALFLYKLMISFSDCWILSKPIKKFWKNSKGEIIRAKDQLKIISSSQELFYFLSENDYMIKSKINFNKVWNIIPNEFKKYFILGLFDGDGHFNYQLRTKKERKYHTGEFSITGSYDYDWSTLEIYFNEIGVEFSIYRLIVPLGRVSKFIVRKKESLIKLFNLIYINDFHGLERKYIKFLKFYEKVKK